MCIYTLVVKCYLSTFPYAGSTYPQDIHRGNGYPQVVLVLSTGCPQPRSYPQDIHKLSTGYPQDVHRLSTVAGCPQVIHTLIHRISTGSTFVNSFYPAQDQCLTALYTSFLTGALQPAIWSGHYSCRQRCRPSQTCFRIHVL